MVQNKDFLRLLYKKFHGFYGIANYNCRMSNILSTGLNYMFQNCCYDCQVSMPELIVKHSKPQRGYNHLSTEGESLPSSLATV